MHVFRGGLSNAVAAADTTGLWHTTVHRIRPHSTVVLGGNRTPLHRNSVTATGDKTAGVGTGGGGSSGLFAAGFTPRCPQPQPPRHGPQRNTHPTARAAWLERGKGLGQVMGVTHKGAVYPERHQGDRPRIPPHRPSKSSRRPVSLHAAFAPPPHGFPVPFSVWNTLLFFLSSLVCVDT